jgi:large subunit ribosomal protein L21
VDYAVIRTGGLQYRVSQGDLIRVPRVSGDVGDTLEVAEVLAVKSGQDFTVGTPVVSGAHVSVEVVGHGRGNKVIVYKKKRRKGYQVKRGHRQDYTELRIKEILL